MWVHLTHKYTNQPNRLLIQRLITEKSYHAIIITTIMQSTINNDVTTHADALPPLLTFDDAPAASSSSDDDQSTIITANRDDALKYSSPVSKRVRNRPESWTSHSDAVLATPIKKRKTLPSPSGWFAVCLFPETTPTTVANESTSDPVSTRSIHYAIDGACVRIVPENFDATVERSNYRDLSQSAGPPDIYLERQRAQSRIRRENNARWLAMRQQRRARV